MQQPDKTIEDMLAARDISWDAGVQYPTWVDLSQVGPDQFYTRPSTAAACLDNLLGFLRERNLTVEDCLFVEPSAGSGAFLSALPTTSSVIAMDLDPRSPFIEQCDFLTWDAGSDERIIAARRDNKTIVALGNPPFGRRGWMALSFLNKCATFADYCAFLLPMSFASEGKGSPKYRVAGMRNICTEELLKEEFLLSAHKTRKFNVVWQIWERGDNSRETFPYIDANFVIKFVCDLSYRRCGQDFKDEADVFVSQAYFPGTTMCISENWDEILYASAYGIKALDCDKDKMIDVLVNADWNEYSTASTHGCRHVGMTEIKKVLATAFYDTGACGAENADGKRS